MKALMAVVLGLGLAGDVLGAGDEAISVELKMRIAAFTVSSRALIACHKDDDAGCKTEATAVNLVVVGMIYLSREEDVAIENIPLFKEYGLCLHRFAFDGEGDLQDECLPILDAIEGSILSELKRYDE